MSWRVVRTGIPQGECPNQDYGVWLTASLEFVIFTHGNNDKGVYDLTHLLQPALVIEAWALRRHGMAECLGRVMSNCKPNEWGYT